MHTEKKQGLTVSINSCRPCGLQTSRHLTLYCTHIVFCMRRWDDRKVFKVVVASGKATRTGEQPMSFVSGGLLQDSDNVDSEDIVRSVFPALEHVSIILCQLLQKTSPQRSVRASFSGRNSPTEKLYSYQRS